MLLIIDFPVKGMLHVLPSWTGGGRLINCVGGRRVRGGDTGHTCLPGTEIYMYQDYENKNSEEKKSEGM